MRQAVGELVVAALVARAPDVRDEVVGDAVELARVQWILAILNMRLTTFNRTSGTKPVSNRVVLSSRSRTFKSASLSITQNNS